MTQNRVGTDEIVILPRTLKPVVRRRGWFWRLLCRLRHPDPAVGYCFAGKEWYCKSCQTKVRI